MWCDIVWKGGGLCTVGYEMGKVCVGQSGMGL